ncbi:M48 family metallopeptidase [candidate division WOR-3 bacterium]|nr:M48 family metallopeptidase [candidate division WOR-3 bacterium]
MADRPAISRLIQLKKKAGMNDRHVRGGYPIEHTTKYRRIKFPRLELKSGELEAIMPQGKDPGVVLRKHMAWVHNRQEFIIRCLEAAKELDLLDRSIAEFQLLTAKILTRYQADLNVHVNCVFYRKMRTKWASCSPSQNLTINTIMKYLPKRHIEYIIYHELIHLIERRHNKRFWELAATEFKNHQKIELSLFSYWFAINAMIPN